MSCWRLLPRCCVCSPETSRTCCSWCAPTTSTSVGSKQTTRTSCPKDTCPRTRTRRSCAEHSSNSRKLSSWISNSDNEYRKGQLESRANSEHADKHGQQCSESLAHCLAFLSFLLSVSFVAALRNSSYAVDIGASPGGWSDYLASLGCQVLAIDPGAVHCVSPLVRHVAKLVQDAGEELRDFAAQAPDQGLTLLVCDMNVRPTEAVALIRDVATRCPMSPRASLVLTCKETTAGRSKLLVNEALAALSDCWTNFRTFHLLSNGKERTVVADWMPSTPHEREARRLQLAQAAEKKAQEWEDKIKANPHPVKVALSKSAKKKIKEQKKKDKMEKAATPADTNAAAQKSSAAASSVPA